MPSRIVVAPAIRSAKQIRLIGRSTITSSSASNSAHAASPAIIDREGRGQGRRSPRPRRRQASRPAPRRSATVIPNGIASGFGWNMSSSRLRSARLGSARIALDPSTRTRPDPAPPDPLPSHAILIAARRRPPVDRRPTRTAGSRRRPQGLRDSASSRRERHHSRDGGMTRQIPHRSQLRRPSDAIDRPCHQGWPRSSWRSPGVARLTRIIVLNR